MQVRQSCVLRATVYSGALSDARSGARSRQHSARRRRTLGTPAPAPSPAPEPAARAARAEPQAVAVTMAELHSACDVHMQLCADSARGACAT